MRLTNAFKYQMLTLIQSMGIYYVIILFIRLLGMFFAMQSDSGDIGMSALEVNTLLFMIILGVLSYLEDSRFLVQNGYSRKSLMKIYIMQFLLCAFMLSLLDVIIAKGTTLILPYESIFTQIYGSGQTFISQFIWYFTLYLLGGMISFFFTVLFERLDKKKRIIYLFGIPFILVMLAIIIDIYIIDHALSIAALDLLTTIMGFAGTINLYAPILTFTVLFAIFTIFAYLMICRAAIQQL